MEVEMTKSTRNNMNKVKVRRIGVTMVAGEKMGQVASEEGEAGEDQEAGE